MNLSGCCMGFPMYLVNKHVLRHLLQSDICQKVGRKCKPDWADGNDGESAAFMRRQTWGCSNTDATTRQCVTEREEEAAAFILGGMGGDTSGVISRVREEKLSLQGKGIFTNIHIHFYQCSSNKTGHQNWGVNMSANLAGFKKEVSAAYVHW